jgi:hypothetical protein
MPLPGCIEAYEVFITETREGREGNAEEDNGEEDPVKIFSVLNSASRPGPLLTARIQVGEEGQPIRTLVPRSGARGPEGGPLMNGSAVWPPPPPPSSSI